jgi:hypothetical protein
MMRDKNNNQNGGGNMKRKELIEKLATGNYLLWKHPWAGGCWRLVDKETRIPCDGRINPKTAAELIKEESARDRAE